MPRGLVGANIRYALRGGYRLPPDAHKPGYGHTIPLNFAGVCVASNEDPACDDVVVSILRDMGINHVRVDVTYGDESTYVARFLDRLLSDSFRVLLHPVQPRDEARQMHTRSAQERWRASIITFLERWGDAINAIEIGSTVNRRKWAGYTIPRFRIAWQIAHEETRRRGVTLAGPNVSDFEPVYNVALLDWMRRKRCVPDVHTFNLFAERATEPECFDHKVAGPRLAPWLKFNLIKKSRLLQRIGAEYGVPTAYSTHVAWSKRRINRVLADVEGKQADYLARYYILAAAAGSLARVYWGPLIGQREGIIDDGTDEYPDPVQHVTLYRRVPGQPATYRARPAQKTFKTLLAWLPGARYEGRVVRSDHLEIHAFSRNNDLIHACWTRNGEAADVRQIYAPDALASAEWTTRDGEAPIYATPLITESPLYIRWRKPSHLIPVDDRSNILNNFSISSSAAPFTRLIAESNWRGALTAANEDEHAQFLQALHPDHVDASHEGAELLRDARNTIWSIPSPIDPDVRLVIKHQRAPRMYRRLLDCHKQSKAQRHWNGAHELIRRGISTPQPVAFFEDARGRAVWHDSFYISTLSPATTSVRKFFNAYASGATVHEGVEEDVFYKALVPFLLNLHGRGVFYRDLSAGNVLVEILPDSVPAFSLIDTGRARFYTHAVSWSQRVSDLKRIVHPLHWAGRDRLVGLYGEALNVSFSGLRRWPFHLYDWKHRLKKNFR